MTPLERAQPYWRAEGQGGGLTPDERDALGRDEAPRGLVEHAAAVAGDFGRPFLGVALAGLGVGVACALWAAYAMATETSPPDVAVGGAVIGLAAFFGCGPAGLWTLHAAGHRDDVVQRAEPAGSGSFVRLVDDQPHVSGLVEREGIEVDPADP